MPLLVEVIRLYVFQRQDRYSIWTSLIVFVFNTSIYSQLSLIRTLWGIVKMFELQKLRITEIRITQAFCSEICMCPENFARISESSNYTSSNKNNSQIMKMHWYGDI